MKAHLNFKEFEITSSEILSKYLDEVGSTENAEAWIVSPTNTSLCLMKAGTAIFLMYLRFSEDTGFVTRSDSKRNGMCEFFLANGQADEYPLSWCVDKSAAFDTVVHFYENSGAKSPAIGWQIVQSLDSTINHITVVNPALFSITTFV